MNGFELYSAVIYSCIYKYTVADFTRLLGNKSSFFLMRVSQMWDYRVIQRSVPFVSSINFTFQHADRISNGKAIV